MPLPSKPTLRVDPPAEFPAGRHGYFDALSKRADCLASYPLRSQAEIDAYETLKSGMSPLGEWRFPVTYDPLVDAAGWLIDPRTGPTPKGSTDGEHKRVPINITGGSMLLTWDLRFDEGHRYKGNGYMGRHKTYMVGWHAPGSGDNRYIGLHTDYKNAADDGQGIAKLRTYMIGPTWLGPGTTLGAQSQVLPMAGEFYIEVNTWTRVWVYLEDIGKPTSFLSVWVADPTRGPVQLQNRNAVIVPPGGITKFWYEYDTSQEEALNGEMKSWNRNAVVLKDVSPADVLKLLVKP